ncbi:NADPH-dependent F420 reductase [Actinomadura livida]
MPRTCPSRPRPRPAIREGAGVRNGRPRVPPDLRVHLRGQFMRIAIIGAGNVGGAIARACVQTGHDVVITAADPGNAQDVASKTGAQAADTNAAAAQGADMVVLAVPYAAVESVASEIAGGVSGRVVLDATNPLKPDYSGLAVTDRSAAEVLQESLPQAAVVKAFNTVFATNQADPVVDGTRLDGFYAGDDEAAKEKVADLLTAVGYRPIDVGGLAAARALEHMAFLNISLNAGHGWQWRSGWKLVGPTT